MAVVKKAVETFNLTKRFRPSTGYRDLLPFWRKKQEVLAVDGVNLEIKQGRIFGLLGPNGAGKTTLVKLLSTLVAPHSGKALVCGRDVVREGGEVRCRVGLICGEERSFYWRLTGRQNLEFFAALYDLYGSRARKRISEVLELVGLSADSEKRYQNYSTGMKQKLAIARGLLHDPQVLFMDEPMRSLDPVSAYTLSSFVKDTLVRRMGKTVVLVTHHLEEAEALCDELALMVKGKIIAQGTVAEIKSHVPHGETYTLEVKGLSCQELEPLRDIPNVVNLALRPSNPHGYIVELTLSDGRAALPPTIEHIVARGGSICRCDRSEISLEEAYIFLVKEKGHA